MVIDMRTATAQLPEHGDDTVFVTANAVIVLDGATAFTPVPVPAATYAHQLGTHLHHHLDSDPSIDLRHALAHAITETANDLALRPGQSPSSTVAIIREHNGDLDALILGDTPIIMPTETICDERIDALNLPERQLYRDRLTTGSGYDEDHRRLLRQLQTQQARWRNTPGGYWIAETDPTAAAHALTFRRSTVDTPWAILATDGAYHTITHLGLGDWHTIAHYHDDQLAGLLHHCEAWEATQDPHGQNLPRAKRHDDKTLAVIRWNGTQGRTATAVDAASGQLRQPSQMSERPPAGSCRTT